MARRRLHTKSRKGCQECKRRKVKCDEVHPSCFNCSRYGVTCSFEAEGTRRLASASFGPPKVVSPESTYDLPSTESPPLRADNPQLPIESPPIRPNNLLLSDVFQSRPHNFVDVGGLVEPWRRDLELMHHYSTVTSSTFAHQEAAKLVWRDIFPQEGYTHEFIMHEVLSLAALHKAFLLPGKRDAYLARSAYHHSVAQKTFAAQISDVTNENWRAVFCFATVVIADVLCQPVLPEATPTTTSITKTLELFSVTKGIRNTLLRFIPRLYETNLAPLGQSCWLVSVDPPPDPKPTLEYSPLPSDTFHAFTHLRRILKDEEPVPNPTDYEQAIWNLDVSAMQMALAGVNIEFGAVLMWAFFLPDSITDDIKDLKPHALVIMAHFAVLMNILDKSYWFLRGWGRRLLEDIDAHLREMPRYRKYLAWPRKHIVA